MEKKKLIVNCAVCDARNVSELTLKSCESIEINAASIFLSKETKELFSLYNVSMNAADVHEIPPEAELIVQNGYFEISEATVMQRPTVLVVNGSLSIKQGAWKALEKLLLIIVNGQISYPSDMQGHLPASKVNGATDCYPADAIRLDNKVIIDRPFIIKAKKNAKYYAKNKVVIADELLNISALKEKEVSFITKRAIISENHLEDALPLFNEDAGTEVIPPGYSYVAGGKLNDALVRKHGGKLYIDGDFIISNESGDALDKLTGIKARGAVLVSDNLMDKFSGIDAEYENIKPIKGTIIEDKGTLSIEKSMLDISESGITVTDCGVIKLKDDITPEEIKKKLQFIDCGCIFCNKEQKSAVELVSEDVGQIIDSNEKSGFLNGLFGGSDLYDKNTQVINAATYTM